MTDDKPATTTADDIGQGTIAASLFQNGTAQVGGMVTSITLVGQAFANLHIHSAAAPLAAFVFATLLAVYQVSIIQKAPRRSCFLLIPIATLILFALSYAGNNTIAPPADTGPLEQELALAKAELELQQRQLATANGLIAQFQQALAPRPPADGDPQTLEQPVPGPAEQLLDGLIRTAAAQITTSVANQQQLSQAIKAYQAQQAKLQQEQQALDRKRRELQQQATGTSLWRPWGRPTPAKPNK